MAAVAAKTNNGHNNVIVNLPPKTKPVGPHEQPFVLPAAPSEGDTRPPDSSVSIFLSPSNAPPTPNVRAPNLKASRLPPIRLP